MIRSGIAIQNGRKSVAPGRGIGTCDVRARRSPVPGAAAQPNRFRGPRRGKPVRRSCKRRFLPAPAGPRRTPILPESPGPQPACRIRRPASAAWRQMLADVFGKPVVVLETQEGSAYGAALLALVGTGAYNSVEQVCRAAVREIDSVAPRPREQEIYARGHRTYQSLYPALQTFCHSV